MVFLQWIWSCGKRHWWDAEWMFKCFQVMDMYKSVRTSSWIVTEGHNQAQPHTCLQWLRVAAWAKDPCISGLNHSAKVFDLCVVKWPCCSATEPDWFPKLCKPRTSDKGQAISANRDLWCYKIFFWQTVRLFCHLLSYHFSLSLFVAAIEPSWYPSS